MTPRILLALVTRATRRLQIRDFTNGRESDLNGPIRHAKAVGRMHTHEVPHTPAPHRSDIDELLLAAAQRTSRLHDVMGVKK